MPTKPPGVVSFIPTRKPAPWASLGDQSPRLPGADVSPLLRHRFLAGDELFVALDGRRVRASRGEWQIQVHSIYDETAHRWIQIGLQGATPYSLTVEVSIADEADDIIRAISAWLDDSSESGHVM